MKRAILKGLHCVLCGDEHPTQLHHFKRIGDYETAYDYCFPLHQGGLSNQCCIGGAEL